MATTAGAFDEAININSESVNASECDGDTFRQSVAVPDWVGNLNSEASNNETPWSDVASPDVDDKMLKPEIFETVNESVIDENNLLAPTAIPIVLERYESPNPDGTIDASNVKEVKEVVVGRSNPFDDVDSVPVFESPPIVVAVVETNTPSGSDNPFDDDYIEPACSNTSGPSANPFDPNYNESYANSVLTNPPQQSVTVTTSIPVLQRNNTPPMRNTNTNTTSTTPKPNTSKSQQDMKTLIGYGFNSEKAATGYKHCGYNISKTFQLLYNKIMEIELKDNRDMHCWWRTPFSSRICMLTW